jgi:hypothetical protein
MEAYPPEYIEHNLPLVVLSGLGERQGNPESPPPIYHLESGTKLQGSSQECTGERAQSLLQQFLRIDGSSLPWNASSLPGPSGTVKYKVKAVGRVGMMGGSFSLAMYKADSITVVHTAASQGSSSAAVAVNRRVSDTAWQSRSH